MIRFVALVFSLMMMPSAFAKGCNENLERLSHARAETAAPGANDDRRVFSASFKNFLRSWRFDASLAAVAGTLGYVGPDDGRPVVLGLVAYLAWRAWKRWTTFRASRAGPAPRDPASSPASEKVVHPTRMIAAPPSVASPKPAWPKISFRSSAVSATPGEVEETSSTPPAVKRREAPHQDLAGSEGLVAAPVSSPNADLESASPVRLLTKRPTLALGLQVLAFGVEPVDAAGSPAAGGSMSKFGRGRTALLKIAFRPRIFWPEASWPDLAAPPDEGGATERSVDPNAVEDASPWPAPLALSDARPERMESTTSLPFPEQTADDQTVGASIPVSTGPESPNVIKSVEMVLPILLLTSGLALAQEGAPRPALVDHSAATPMFPPTIELPGPAGAPAENSVQLSAGTSLLIAAGSQRFDTSTGRQFPAPSPDVYLADSSSELAVPVLLLTQRLPYVQPGAGWSHLLEPRDGHRATERSASLGDEPVDEAEIPVLLLTFRPPLFDRAPDRSPLTFSGEVAAHGMNESSPASEESRSNHSELLRAEETHREVSVPVLLLTYQPRLSSGEIDRRRLDEVTRRWGRGRGEVLVSDISSGDLQSDRFEGTSKSGRQIARPVLRLTMRTQESSDHDNRGAARDLVQSQTGARAEVASPVADRTVQIDVPVLLLTQRPPYFQRENAWPRVSGESPRSGEQSSDAGVEVTGRSSMFSPPSNGDDRAIELSNGRVDAEGSVELARPLLLLTYRPRVVDRSEGLFYVSSVEDTTSRFDDRSLASARSSSSQPIVTSVLLLTMRPRLFTVHTRWPDVSTGETRDRRDGHVELSNSPPEDHDAASGGNLPGFELNDPTSFDFSVTTGGDSSRLERPRRRFVKPVATAIVAGLLSVTILDPAIDLSSLARGTVRENGSPATAHAPDQPVHLYAHLAAPSTRDMVPLGSEREAATPIFNYAWQDFKGRVKATPDASLINAPNTMYLAKMPDEAKTVAKTGRASAPKITVAEAKVKKAKAGLKNKKIKIKNRYKRRWRR